VESANITHQFNFASHLPAHLATMFSMSWFGIPNFDPQVIFFYLLSFIFLFCSFSSLFFSHAFTLHYYLQYATPLQLHPHHRAALRAPRSTYTNYLYW
jgi:hypothetical protein